MGRTAPCETPLCMLHDLQASTSDQWPESWWPLLQAWANPDAEQQMALAQSVVSAARKLRSDYNLQRERPKMFIAVRSVIVHPGSAAGHAGSTGVLHSCRHGEAGASHC